MARPSAPATPVVILAALLAAVAVTVAVTAADSEPTEATLTLDRIVEDTTADAGAAAAEAAGTPSFEVASVWVAQRSPADAARDVVEPTRRPITLAFGGDVHFEGRLANALAEDPEAMLAPVADMMADADIAMVNLETAVTERGIPAAKAYVFRAPPTAFVALDAAGVDVVSIANNHGMDYGLVGLTDTLDAAAAADIGIVGGGADANAAYGPWRTEVGGWRVAVIGATQVLDSSFIESWTATEATPGLASAKEVDDLVAAVAAARADSDIVVVYLHWGIEGQRCPAPRQLDLADRLVAAGADVIVGGHAHRLQGGGFNPGDDNRRSAAYVHYGLGNFVFYANGGPGADSGVLRLTMDGREVTESAWVPARLVGGVATELSGDRALAAGAAWEEQRDCTDLDAGADQSDASHSLIQPDSTSSSAVS